MLTEKDYCDYDTCVALKELGYDKPSNWGWHKHIRVSNEILEKYPDLSEGGYQDLIWDGKHTHDEVYKVYIEPLNLYSRNSLINDCETELCACVHLYDAQKFLREEKKIIVNIDIDYNWYYGIYFSEGNTYSPQFSGGEFGSYEEALLEGVREAIKLLKEERK